MEHTQNAFFNLNQRFDALLRYKPLASVRKMELNLNVTSLFSLYSSFSLLPKVEDLKS